MKGVPTVLSLPLTVLLHVWEALGEQLRKLIALDRFEVYVFSRAMTLPSGGRSDLEFRELTRDDFLRMTQGRDRFAEQARLYYVQRGIDSAFGVFVEGELGHISWAYTAEEYRREPYERFRLGVGEAEIVNCFTSRAQRGKGLYPYAIRQLLRRLLDTGFDRVFMITEPRNESSQRGIQKAGLVHSGRVYHLRIPCAAKWRGLYWRRHKRA